MQKVSSLLCLESYLFTWQKGLLFIDVFFWEDNAPLIILLFTLQLYKFWLNAYLVNLGFSFTLNQKNVLIWNYPKLCKLQI